MNKISVTILRAYRKILGASLLFIPTLRYTLRSTKCKVGLYSGRATSLIFVQALTLFLVVHNSSNCMYSSRERPNHTRSLSFIAAGSTLGLLGIYVFLTGCTTNNNTNSAHIGAGLACVGGGLILRGNVLKEQESADFRARQ